jgi:hypothetical protein
MSMSYPQEMTLGGSDMFEIYHTFYELEPAKALAEKIGGQIYTQVGWNEPDETGETDRYAIGIAMLNNNGFYLVVKHGHDKRFVPPMRGCKCSTCEMNEGTK